MPSNVHIDSPVGESKNLRFHQNALSVDLSTNQSSEKFALNEFFLEHIDTKITLMSDTKIDSRGIFYSLYLDLFTKNYGILLSDDLFKDQGVFGRKLLT